MKNIKSQVIRGFPGGFSVLMSVYAKDDEILLTNAVVSIYSNTLIPDQVILVVDGPIPRNLNDSIAFLKDKYPLEVLYLPTNLGLANALNQGIMKINTDWVLRADADDLNLPFRFELQADIVNDFNNSIDILGGAIQEVDSLGNLLGIRKTAELHSDILRYAIKRNPFNHMTVGFKKDFVIKCGGYPRIYLKEDYALWVTMLRAGAVSHNSSKVLVLVSAGSEMYKRRGGLYYALTEIKLQKHLVKNGFKNYLEAILDGLLRAFVFLIPSMLRGMIYERFFRYYRKNTK